MKKHLSLFGGIFLFLAIGMHFKEWTTHPLEHLMALPSSGAYGLGMLHPLVFTLIGFIVVVLILVLVRLLKKIFLR